MGMSEMICPHCGKTNRESCNAWMYGTPIRVCKKCNKKYLDRRYREIAIDGVDPRSTDAMFYVKSALLMIIIFFLCLAVLLYQIWFVGRYHTALLGCVLLSGMGFIACIVLIIRNKLGIEEKSNAKYQAESEKRMLDRAYVQELIDNGYDVPDKYR